MEILFGLLKVAGSLGLFLFGIKMTSDGIQKAAGERLQRALSLMTKNRFTALATGLTITGIIQSSSATTVMTVSFVNAGLLTLQQGIGVILGANIGTTLTAWIIALFGFKFNITSMALPVAGLGIVLYFMKNTRKKSYGEFFIGFAILFLGLYYLKDSVPNIQDHPDVLKTIGSFTGMGFFSYIIFVIIGTILTVVVQSSSATIAITQTMAFAGWIDFPTACAIILGENIGTTATAQIAAFGANVNARRAAMAHTAFNVIGVVWMTIVFSFFLVLVDRLVPGSSLDPKVLPEKLAMFHTSFNIANSFLFIWFVPKFSMFIEKFVKPKDKEDTTYRLQYISTAMQDTPEIQILNAKKEVIKMVEIIKEMFQRFITTFENNEIDLRHEVDVAVKLEDLTDQMQTEISRFLSDCANDSLNNNSKLNISVLIRVTDELESIADSSRNLMYLLQRKDEKKLSWNKKADEEIKPYFQKVYDFINFIQEHMNEHLETTLLKEASDMEKQIDKMRNNLKKSARKRIEKGSDVRSEILFIDIIQQIEHIGDYSMNIAEALSTYKD